MKPNPSEPSGDPVPLLTVTNPLQADMIKAMLESYGIPVMYKSPMITNMAIRYFTVSPIGDIQIMVPPGRAEEAAELLNAMEEGVLRDDYSDDDP